MRGACNAARAARIGRLHARLQAHCADLLDIPYNAFCKIRLNKWEDGRNGEKIERVLPKVADVTARMGY